MVTQEALEHPPSTGTLNVQLNKEQSSLKEI